MDVLQFVERFPQGWGTICHFEKVSKILNLIFGTYNYFYVANGKYHVVYDGLVFQRDTLQELREFILYLLLVRESRRLFTLEKCSCQTLVIIACRSNCPLDVSKEWPADLVLWNQDRTGHYRFEGHDSLSSVLERLFLMTYEIVAFNAEHRIKDFAIYNELLTEVSCRVHEIKTQVFAYEPVLELLQSLET
ncbi:hypothetical protein [Beihai sea slater virus 4]|uniref:hypothetical protein n=1 Tax=Beihai sea slater virus 4 TaxID=1922660 RepID=UPI00090ACDD0|nr:hypothetical protein [Beihai sea slater virus 4]APG77558.1 hypothetical protein [Beihai sea slater virus 4]